MTDTHNAAQTPTGPRRPRVALMGEFSAGKSTLTNLLLGADPLPVKTTATRVPPVWIAHGHGDPLREDPDGGLHPMGAAGLEDVALDDTRLIRMRMQSDILSLCDLVDMPGISDPNMDGQIWHELIEEADLVIWCTHATQAWRQSEAAAFDSLPKTLKANAILLVTRFDKLRSDRDRARVLARLRAETKGLFREIFPVALLDALAAGEDRAKWDASGAEPFIKALIDMLATLRVDADDDATAQPMLAAAEAGDTPFVRPARVAPPTGGLRRARPTEDETQSVPGHV